MPRFRQGERAEFFAVVEAARDLGDATLLRDFLAANQASMPAWAVDMVDRNIHNIQIVNQAQLDIGRGETEDVLPSDVTDVYSLVTIQLPPDETGEEQEPLYRTIKHHMEEGDTIDDVLADIEAVLERWQKDSPTAGENLQVTPLWQVHTIDTTPRFPLQDSV